MTTECVYSQSEGMTAHLDGVRGNSPVISARIRQADAARLTALAELFDMPVSRVIRVALEHGLAKMETETDLADAEPPGQAA